MGKSGTPPAGPQGIMIRAPADQGQTLAAVLTRLDAQDLAHCVLSTEGEDDAGHFIRISLNAEQVDAWAPGYDTLGLDRRLQLDTGDKPADLHARSLQPC